MVCDRETVGLVTHTLKRSAGIGSDGVAEALDEKIGDLADALMVIIAATGFLDVSPFLRMANFVSARTDHML